VTGSRLRTETLRVDEFDCVRRTRPPGVYASPNTGLREGDLLGGLVGAKSEERMVPVRCARPA